MSQPLDELYLIWLYSQVADVSLTHPAKTYWNILRKLFTKEFVWIIPNDDNRLEDGRDLRHEFISANRITHVDETWLRLGCSVLELLIGLARRLSFEAEGTPQDWFWHLLENLGLDSYNDRRRLPEGRVNRILDQLIWRTYSADGKGGLFPLKKAEKDQRGVELWYQLCAYILELDSMKGD